MWYLMIFAGQLEAQISLLAGLALNRLFQTSLAGYRFSTPTLLVLAVVVAAAMLGIQMGDIYSDSKVISQNIDFLRICRSRRAS